MKSRSDFDKEIKFQVEVNVEPEVSKPKTNSVIQNFSGNLEEVAYCNAKKSKPSAEISWIVPKLFSKSDFSTDNVVIADGYKTNSTMSTLRIRAKKEYNKSVFKCKITHPSLKTQQILYSVQVNVECRSKI